MTRSIERIGIQLEGSNHFLRGSHLAARGYQHTSRCIGPIGGVGCAGQDALMIEDVLPISALEGLVAVDSKRGECT